MAEKLLIIVVNANPNNAASSASPIYQATVAASMEYEAEVILTGQAAELAVKGKAESINLPAEAKTLYNLIQEAHEMGVKFKVCQALLAEHEEELIPEIEDIVGGAYLISEAMDAGTITFTY